MELSNLVLNKKRSKKRQKNDYGLITKLVVKYKKSQKESDLLEIIKNLEGIINSFTIIISPGNMYQQIHINPFMAKFIGMFFTKEEKSGKAAMQDYYNAISRIRWVMRHYDYEDIYSHVISELIKIINGMKVIENCDCIYYIQLVARYKMHDFVIKTSRDAGIAIADIPVNKDGLDESPEEILDRLSFSQENLNKSEDAIIDLYDPDSIEILLRKDDIWKCFSYYEKYLIYLHDVMGLKKRQMVSILRHEKLCGVEERLADITEKCRIISNEGE